MDNYEIFKDFLDKNNTRYSEETLVKSGERFFRLPQKLKSGGFVDILIVFAEKNIKIRIFGIATIEEEEKKIACYKLFNELSAQYNFFRIYIHPNGDISLEGDVVLGVIEGEFQPKALMGFVIAAINLLEKSYKDIMKIQWT
ncbi:MAG: hypothetical protein SR1Q5_08335 [Quinella sp. 1Q5]|nr:hypothetical protein [Quinella sp. 1Q5]